eukprot:1122769-Heterocapsa_arctica.AAC.1
MKKRTKDKAQYSLHTLAQSSGHILHCVKFRTHRNADDGSKECNDEGDQEENAKPELHKQEQARK